MPNNNIMSTKEEMALLNKHGFLHIYDEKKAYQVSTLPASVIATEIGRFIKEKQVVVDTYITSAFDEIKQKQKTVISVNGALSVPIVQAKPTGMQGIYTAEIIPNMKPVKIKLEQEKEWKKQRTVVNTQPPVSQYLPSIELKNYHAIVDFGNDNEPLYVSISEQLSQEDEKKLIEQAKKDWIALYPLEAAKQALNEAIIELDVAKKKEDTLKVNVASLQKTYEAKKAEYDEWLKKYSSLPANAIKLVYNAKVKEPEIALNEARKALAIAVESRKKAESKKKAAEDKVNEAKDKKRQGVREKGHDYHPAPKTEEIKGLGELKRGKDKTPKQGGGGTRKRWIGDKGRKIYEWDYQHGEIEGYRASDGQHLGAFDPKTGNQLKPADPKRNIKKYL
ncbi:hypothetical protein JEP64_03850 [Proteus vulgaris]|nr:hypothetical protein [Proteus vulgaris]